MSPHWKEEVVAVPQGCCPPRAAVPNCGSSSRCVAKGLGTEELMEEEPPSTSQPQPVYIRGRSRSPQRQKD